MSSRWIECVPNISEGRDQSIIDEIVSFVATTPGVAILGCEPDPDYNRTVITFAGEFESVAHAAIKLIEKSAELIDMRNHEGNHPRIGAVDVCPFVPISPNTENDCIKASEIVVGHFSNKIPIFLYGSIASDASRESLSALRKGQYESLENRFEGGGWELESTRMPDYWSGTWGEVESRFGAMAIGVRPVLVAYNVNVNEKIPSASKAAGSIIRTSGRLLKNNHGAKIRINGMLTSVQGMGVPLPAHGICQVSMNLQNYEETPMHVAYELIKSICSDHDVSVIGSELVGLVPLDAILEAGRWYSDGEASDDLLIQSAVSGLGLNSLEDFIPEDRIIEWAIANRLGD